MFHFTCFFRDWHFPYKLRPLGYKTAHTNSISFSEGILFSNVSQHKSPQQFDFSFNISFSTAAGFNGYLSGLTHCTCTCRQLHAKDKLTFPFLYQDDGPWVFYSFSCTVSIPLESAWGSSSFSGEVSWCQAHTHMNTDTCVFWQVSIHVLNTVIQISPKCNSHVGHLLNWLTAQSIRRYDRIK